MKHPLVFLVGLLLAFQTLSAAEKFVVFERQSSSVCLTGTQDTIVYDAQEWEGVKMAVMNLRQDLKNVTGKEFSPVIVATVGKSKLADRYASQAKALKGKTEQSDGEPKVRYRGIFINDEAS